MVQFNTIERDISVKTIHLHLAGHVQGVGFRPHVYRLAQALGIEGWVRNQRGEVEILACGQANTLDLFTRRLVDDAPTRSTPQIIDQQAGDLRYRNNTASGFSIIDSIDVDNKNITLPPDLDCCDICLDELFDPENRRYRYPFISCAQCGPRYSAITQLPYDRINTNMDAFPLCSQCKDEYNDVDDRRFHAEAISCPRCGPQLSFVENGEQSTGVKPVLQQMHTALNAGRIVAVKGISGYHLLCAADNSEVIKRLRARKGRPDKPLAVMFSDLDTARRELIITETAAALLCDQSHPIVLCEQGKDSTLSSLIAPGINRIGALLPYSPLHHLILRDYDKPLVATSANIGGEPVITMASEVEQRLGNVADACLHHNREITHPADDSVYQVINNRARPLRSGRGHAPLELTLPVMLDRPLLAVGGQMKNSIALAWDDRIAISPHIGELDSPRSVERFKKSIESLQRLYNVTAEGVVCDAHPNYCSSRWSDMNDLPVTQVYHHPAHASALVGEYNINERCLLFTWDGSGLGADDTLWGGEALLGRPGSWQRVATFRPFRLPGGERAAREPWRCAASLCWQAGEQWRNHPQAALLYDAWQKGINAPQSSSIGRLFDGAASLLGLIDQTSFEGQAAMLLQASAETAEIRPARPLPHSRDDAGVIVSDWQPLLNPLREQKRSVAERAAHFHAVLAQTLCHQAVQLRQKHGEFVVGLNGGVFQNRLLSEQAMALLEQQGFDVYLPQQLPCNDAALCYGQIIEAAASQ